MLDSLIYARRRLQKALVEYGFVLLYLVCFSSFYNMICRLAVTAGIAIWTLGSWGYGTIIHRRKLAPLRRTTEKSSFAKLSQSFEFCLSSDKLHYSIQKGPYWWVIRPMHVNCILSLHTYNEQRGADDNNCVIYKFRVYDKKLIAAA